MKLRAKFLLSLVLVVAVLTSTTLLVVRRAFQHQVSQALANDLRSSAQTFSILQHDRKELLMRSAQLVADAPSLHAMMTSNDPQTIQDASSELVSAAHSDLFLISGRHGRLMALRMSRREPDRRDAEEWVRHLQLAADQEQWLFAEGRLYQTFTKPMYSGTPVPAHLLGFVTVGYEVSDSVVQKVANSSGTEVIFVFGHRVVATTLSEVALSNCFRTVSSDPNVSKGAQRSSLLALEGVQKTVQFSVGGERHLATSIRLGSEPVLVTLIVLKSFNEADQVLARVNRILLLVGVTVTGMGCLLIFGISKKFGRPLEELLGGVRALSHQDFGYPLKIRTSDEFGELTAAFETMRGSLVLAQKQLLQAQQLATIGQTAGSLSHDLRHRLTLILANSEFLVDEKSGPRREQLYQGIRFAVRQMTELLDSLLEFARSPHSLNCKFVDLQDLVQESVREIRLYPQFSRITVTVSSSGPVKAWFDGKRLHRAFFNVLFNACEAVSPETGEVEILLQRVHTKVEVRITDNGPGISSQIRDRLFKPFVSSGKNKGTGLGLAIVQKCCQDHGGEVELEASAAGQTTFKLVLPLAGIEEGPSENSDGSEILSTQGNRSEMCLG